MKLAKVLICALALNSSVAKAAENNLGVKVIYEEPNSMALDEIQPSTTIIIRTLGCSLVDENNISDVSLELDCRYFRKPGSRFRLTLQEFTYGGTHIGAKDLAKMMLSNKYIVCAYKGKKDALNSCVYTKEIFTLSLNQKK